MTAEGDFRCVAGRGRYSRLRISRGADEQGPGLPQAAK